MPKSFWAFAVYLLIGLLIVNYVPSGARGWLIALLVAGGLVYVQQHGGLQSMIDTLEGKG